MQEQQQLHSRASAISSVFNTYELLEQVLRHLDFFTLINTAPNVSKTWRNLLKTSPILQWVTWKWKGTSTPICVRDDQNLRALRLVGDKEYHCEFCCEVVEWLRAFWSATVEPMMKNRGREDDTVSAMVDLILEKIPDIELFRPRFEEERVGVTFTWNRIIDQKAEVTLVDQLETTELDIPRDKLTLKNFIRLIFVVGLSTDGNMRLPRRVYIRQRTDEAMNVELDRRRKFNLVVEIYGRCRREHMEEVGLKENEGEGYEETKSTRSKSSVMVRLAFDFQTLDNLDMEINYCTSNDEGIINTPVGSEEDGSIALVDSDDILDGGGADEAIALALDDEAVEDEIDR
ncbi:hypothetical protein TWF281_010090 [Arthrobotrys megalospora]